MFLFAHAGITAGTVKLADLVFPHRPEKEAANGFRGVCARTVDRLRGRSGIIDYRIVLAGSVFPDIVDKPLALLLKNPEIFNGRGFSHTMLVTVIILIAAAAIRQPWLYLLTLGMIFHLVLDSIWEMPETLFWPLLGGFIPDTTENWVATMWGYLISDPSVYIPEVTGVVILTWLVFRVVRGKGIIRFIRRGMIS